MGKSKRLVCAYKAAVGFMNITHLQAWILGIDVTAKYCVGMKKGGLGAVVYSCY